MLHSALRQVASNTLLMLRSALLQVTSNTLLMLRSALHFFQVTSNTLLMLRSALLQVTSNTLLMLRCALRQVTSNKLLMLRSALLQVTSNTRLMSRSNLALVLTKSMKIWLTSCNACDTKDERDTLYRYKIGKTNWFVGGFERLQKIDKRRNPLENTGKVNLQRLEKQAAFCQLLTKSFETCRFQHLSQRSDFAERSLRRSTNYFVCLLDLVGKRIH